MMGRQGATAELAAVDERWLYPNPDNFEDKDLAAIALVGITAYLGLYRDGMLKPGEAVFVNGGAGGVGAAVVQLARAGGARVIATAGSEENAMVCRELGANEVILYKRESVTERVRAFAPNGINLWFETLRRRLMTNIPLLAHAAGYPDGRTRRQPAAAAGRVLHPRLPLLGLRCSMPGRGTAPRRRPALRNDARRKTPRPHGATFPIDRIAYAHQLQEDTRWAWPARCRGKL
jgi:NADPH2:quinone reductase